jgi:nitric oxide synthase oxygenase domain/subunit
MIKQFDFKNLNEKAQAVYESIVKEKMHIGDPHTMINMMFERFEQPFIKSTKDVRSNYTHDLLLFY